MKKVKVAFCLRDMQLGGVESVLIRTLEQLVLDKKFDITVVTYVDLIEPTYVDWFRAHTNIKRIVLYPSKYFGTRMPRFFLWRVIKHLCRDVYRAVRRKLFVPRMLGGYDTFIDYHDFGFASELKKLSAKKIAWFHSGLNVFIKRKFVNRVSGYDKVVVLTDDCANDLRKLCPQYSDKFMRIYNPIDIQNIKMLAREKCPISGQYFCCVARMSYDKDIRTIMDAFDSVYRYYPDVRLVFVGSGDKLEVFKHYAAGLKSFKNIVFLGAQQNPFVYMKNAVANILSSNSEGLPTVLIESQAVGAINISSNCKYGPREILLGGDAGVLFEPGKALELATRMIDVYEKRVDVRAMKNAATRGLIRFDKDEIMNQIKSLIS